jgi:hypothetical protein
MGVGVAIDSWLGSDVGGRGRFWRGVVQCSSIKLALAPRRTVRRDE